MNENMCNYIMYKKILLIHPLQKANLSNICSTKPALAFFRPPLFHCYLMILFLSDAVILVYNTMLSIYLFFYLFFFIHFSYFYFQFI